MYNYPIFCLLHSAFQNCSNCCEYFSNKKKKYTRLSQFANNHIKILKQNKTLKKQCCLTTDKNKLDIKKRKSLGFYSVSFLVSILFIKQRKK